MSSMICDQCGGPYIKISEKLLGDSNYVILKCEKCGHQVARSK